MGLPSPGVPICNSTQYTPYRDSQNRCFSVGALDLRAVVMGCTFFFVGSRPGLGRIFREADKGLDWCGQPCRGLVEMGQHDCSEISEEYTDIDVKRKFFVLAYRVATIPITRVLFMMTFYGECSLNPDP